jgi:hypothetical protein
MTACMLGVDYFLVPYVQFPLFFLAPVSLAAWHRGAAWGTGIALAVTIGRAVSNTAWGVDLSVSLWAAALRILLLFGYAYLVARTGKQTRALEREVRMLRGILPICSFCKRIRDEQARWQQLEIYITEKSEAKFTHSLCPECISQHYPDVLLRK